MKNEGFKPMTGTHISIVDRKPSYSDPNKLENSAFKQVPLIVSALTFKLSRERTAHKDRAEKVPVISHTTNATSASEMKTLKT